jgi:prophage DNA circulation protein
MATFSMSFTEAGRNEYPTVAVDKLFNVDSAAFGVAGAAASEFIGKFKALELPEFVRDIAKADIGTLSTKLLGFDFPGASTDLVSDFIQQANNLRVNAERLIRTPGALASQITGLIQQVRGIMATGTGENAQAFNSLISYTSEAPASTITPSQAQAAANGDAITALVRDTAIGEQASAAVRGTYESYDEAVDARDDMLESIDAQAELAADPIYVAFQILRAQVVSALPVDEENLPRLSTVRLPESIPAVVLAYGLYDDTTRDGEIVSRNRVAHPGFLPSNRDLQVLSDG